MEPDKIYDVGIVGCGIAGMATAMRLQAQGLSTIVLESHGQPGGCAGYFTKKGFSFDVGATTLVDFNEAGVGGEFFKSIGLSILKTEQLDYQLWLPDRSIKLCQDKNLWEIERLEKFGNSENHISFWKFMDHLADVFWNASRNGIKLPVQNTTDALQGIKAIGLKNIYLLKYLSWTVDRALKKFQVDKDMPLRSMLAMLVEDTLHTSLKDAPLINAALGITIRGAGIHRASGGMKGLWMHLTEFYKNKNGALLLGHKVEKIRYADRNFEIITSKGNFICKKIISALSAKQTSTISPEVIASKINPYLIRDEKAQGSAVVVFLGVPEAEVSSQPLTHHQLLYDYKLPLGNGNNMFISVSSPDDILSAPKGYRSVMISTHCTIEEWLHLDEDAYQEKKKSIGQKLIQLAKKIYPLLGDNAIVYEVGTPRTYQKYTGRINGAVGGFKQTLFNSNFNAIPQNLGIKNFCLVGDTTWPGLGTVACILGSKIAAKEIMKN